MTGADTNDGAGVADGAGAGADSGAAGAAGAASAGAAGAGAPLAGWSLVYSPAPLALWSLRPWTPVKHPTSFPSHPLFSLQSFLPLLKKKANPLVSVVVEPVTGEDEPELLVDLEHLGGAHLQVALHGHLPQGHVLIAKAHNQRTCANNLIEILDLLLIHFFFKGSETKILLGKSLEGVICQVLCAL